MERSQEAMEEMHRVKVYCLNPEGTWDDKGIGTARVDETPNGEQTLVVVGEGDASPTLLVAKVNLALEYQRQGEGTIITWTDPEYSTDVALSFQHEAGCEVIWKQIQQQGNLFQPKDAEGQLRGHAVTGMIDEVSRNERAVMYPDAGASQAAETPFAADLPALELGHLPQIAKMLSEVPFYHREGVSTHLQQTGFLPRLMEIFRMVEDLEDKDSLHHIYSIVKAVIMLNDPALLDMLFNDDMIMDAIGTLEYDPSFSEPQRHRDFLKKQVRFREVVPIKNKALLSKIHQTFKISYIKDSILPIVLDDATFSTFSSTIIYNQVEIVGALHQDPEFLPGLFARLKEVPRESQDWNDLLALLQEICDLARHMQPQQRSTLFGSLIQLGLFSVMGDILQLRHSKGNLKGMDIMLSALHHDPNHLRTFLMSQKDYALLSALMQAMVSEREDGLQEQMADFLCRLLDPETMDSLKTDFLDLFYNKFFGVLLNALSWETSASTLVLCMDLLCFCVHCHAVYIKYFIMRNKMFERLTKLLGRRERMAVLGAIRLFRSCLGLKDDFYVAQLIENNVVSALVDILVRSDQYNMVNSSLLEFFEYIRRENVKKLVTHVCERYGDALKNLKYTEVFAGIALRHAQNAEADKPGGAKGEEPSATLMVEQQLVRSRQRRDGSMDKEEEDYFESDDGMDDEQDIRGMPLMSEGGMVGPAPPPHGAPFMEAGPIGVVPQPMAVAHLAEPGNGQPTVSPLVAYSVEDPD